MNELHLFAGAGGGILGGELLGHTTVCAVEIEEYPRKDLLQRQRDGLLPRFPIWDDIRTFDGRDWQNQVDIVCGGFPCQNLSVAGDGTGLNGEKSSLWKEQARVIGEIQPPYVLVENSPALTSRGLGVVLGDLAAMGYNARWGVLGAVDVGASHKRERIWIVASNPVRQRLQGGDGLREEVHRGTASRPIQALVQGEVWPDVSDPRAYGSDDGIPDRVERTKAIGNAQVPAVAALAWRLLGGPVG